MISPETVEIIKPQLGKFDLPVGQCTREHPNHEQSLRVWLVELAGLQRWIHRIQATGVGKLSLASSSQDPVLSENHTTNKIKYNA